MSEKTIKTVSFHPRCVILVSGEKINITSSASHYIQYILDIPKRFKATDGNIEGAFDTLIWVRSILPYAIYRSTEGVDVWLCKSRLAEVFGGVPKLISIHQVERSDTLKIRKGKKWVKKLLKSCLLHQDGSF